MLSELSLPIPLLNRVFKNTLPFLGPNWGTGFLGVLLVVVAGDGLSRGNIGGRLEEVGNWILASLGVVNVIIGILWRAKVKLVRSPMGWKKDVAERMGKLADAKARAEKVVDEILPTTTQFKVAREIHKETEGEEGGGGLKGLFGLAGKAIANQLDRRQERKKAMTEFKQQESEIEKKHVEKAMTEFTSATNEEDFGI
uniref:Uncharacterized protein n=1 Tax=Melanopsichium pennsylvanicum 4 TaxID=1398559 RepID=A0A077QQV3_9BASI|nr:conserved hypothetical protein [Melanopsichium pennsylvanicum 4]